MSQGPYPPPVTFSRYMAVFDSLLEGEQVRLWREKLVPFVKSESGAMSPTSPATVVVSFEPDDAGNGALGPGCFVVSNVTGTTLTNVVLELKSKSGWGEETEQYEYLRSLDPGAAWRITPYHQLGLEGATISSLAVEGFLWSDQLSGALTGSRQDNPHPVVRVGEAHARFLENKLREEPIALVWGTLVLAKENLLGADAFRRFTTPSTRRSSNGGLGGSETIPTPPVDRVPESNDATTRKPGVTTRRPVGNISPEGAIDRAFVDWSRSWIVDRYIPESARVLSSRVEEVTTDVLGTFDFKRSGKLNTFRFGATLKRAGSNRYTVTRLCYESLLEADCDHSLEPAERDLRRPFL